jgi:nucleotide-binding universal stress UspA family protein
MLVTGGPVLLLPPEYAAAAVGARPLVAWKNARESARAMRDALPFLIEAEDVTILTVREEGGADLPGTEVASALAWHGVNVELRNRTSSAGRAGDVILAEAAERGCDMVVMGAYGRAEQRQVVFGDVTQHMLRHAPMPLLVSY